MKICSIVLATIFVLIVCLAQVQTQTPAELAQGTRGMSPVEYHELSLEARRFFDANTFNPRRKSIGRERI
jgi:hypothetical protein